MEIMNGILLDGPSPILEVLVVFDLCRPLVAASIKSLGILANRRAFNVESHPDCLLERIL